MRNKLSSISLTSLPGPLKKLIFGTTLLLTTGVSVGLVFLYDTTSLSTAGAVERYRGDISTSKFEIPENYPKPYSELLLTTHNHLIGFSFIFMVICFIFYFSHSLPVFLKNFLLFEPFISVLLTFGSLWLVRFIHADFILVTIISAIMTYVSYYFITAVIWYEILVKKQSSS